MFVKENPDRNIYIYIYISFLIKYVSRKLHLESWNTNHESLNRTLLRITKFMSAQDVLFLLKYQITDKIFFLFHFVLDFCVGTIVFKLILKVYFYFINENKRKSEFFALLYCGSLFCFIRSTKADSGWNLTSGRRCVDPQRFPHTEGYFYYGAKFYLWWCTKSIRNFLKFIKYEIVNSIFDYCYGASFLTLKKSYIGWYNYACRNIRLRLL